MELRVNKVLKKYAGNIVLDEISLILSEVNVVAIIGPSGGGKSTFLRLLAGLEECDDGKIMINEHDLSKDDLDSYRKKVGYVFQDNNLFPHLTVFKNISLVLEKVHDRPEKANKDLIEGLLKQYGLLEHKDKYPHQISGGQAQRASIVRALAINPEILLLDEPTSALDPALTYEVLQSIKKLKDNNKDFIIVTHEIGFAKHIADHIVYIDNQKIIEHGSVDILNNPKTEELKKFLDKVLSYE
ncbi:amino acid ABC transporter ATP-binding protein [Oceanirhabdus sp. W0125-5]|uniref:amino acid ABC transporter ATP-binding protein n=1 Tax=Oceanirhabdus sp. W0125-5 TaxID=2999116 RepID=UPI0022F30B0C|nr:ATP-binding cassette domain-containing protein [Oceanirhabdus sp. W0125-5]WBW97858.1 ATP-binding cassette domain-containing protein [Oceanirhabdus sp. W0125-5]